MDFFSETKFNAPIKGQNNESGNPDLKILGGVTVSAAEGEEPALITINPADQNVTINGTITIQPTSIETPALTMSVDHRIDVGVVISSTKSINTSDNITADGNISACGSISACGDITTAEGTITAKTITGQCSINTGDLTVSGFLTSGMIQASGDIIAATTTIRGRYLVAGGGGIELAGETITSWAELKGLAGPSIQRFTSPEIPANCSQFYFEGCNLVTGSELPFIQVRETATGKLVQMDVWVNLDGCCSGFTVGKPVANIQPCSTTTEAGAWTAIVMN